MKKAKSFELGASNVRAVTIKGLAPDEKAGVDQKRGIIHITKRRQTTALARSSRASIRLAIVRKLAEDMSHHRIR